MPSLSTYKISPPTDSKEFELLLMNYSAAKYGGEADLYGRQGQKQDGIDIIVTLPQVQAIPTASPQPSNSSCPSVVSSQASLVSNLICVQCKAYKPTRVTTTKIDAWIKEAEAFPFPILKLVIAIINERDVALQEHVLKVNQVRLQQGKFPVEIVFWDSISNFIKQNDNILRNYYPELYNSFVTTKAMMQNSMVVNHYPNLILSEEDLKLSFLDLFTKHYIKSFMEATPFVGFSVNLVGEYDVFEIEVEQLKNKAIQISSSPKYKEIDEFMYAISDFATFITLKSTVSNAGFVLITPEIRMQYDLSQTIEAELKHKREQTVKLFRKVLS